MKTINIAEEFSKYPCGRFREDSPFSGEALREDILIPQMKLHGRLSVELDGTLGYSSSFLEEAFQGFHKSIIPVTKDEVLKYTIQRYLDS